MPARLLRRAMPALSLLAGLLLSTAAMPESADAQKIREEISENDMERILKSMGLEPVKVKENTFRIELNGYRVMLFLLNENTDAQLYVGFGDKIVTAARVNEWNQQKRFTRAYADKDNNPVLEADLDFVGGVTEDAVKACIRLYRDLIGTYVKFLNE